MEDRKGWRGPPGGTAGVEKPFRRDERVGRGRVALPVGQEKSRGPPGELSGVRSPSQRAGCGRKALLEGREKSRGPPSGLEGVRRPSWWAGYGREAYLEGREGQTGSGSPTRVQEGLGGCSMGPEGFGRVSRCWEALLEGR